MNRGIFAHLRKLWNRPPKASHRDDAIGAKRMAVSSLLTMRRLVGQQDWNKEFGPAFLDYGDVDVFIELYLEQPHPEWVSEFLRFLGSQREFPQGSDIPMAGFLFELVAQNPDLAGDWKSITEVPVYRRCDGLILSLGVGVVKLVLPWKVVSPRLMSYWRRTRR